MNLEKINLNLMNLLNYIPWPVNKSKCHSQKKLYFTHIPNTYYFL